MPHKSTPADGSKRERRDAARQRRLREARRRERRKHLRRWWWLLGVAAVVVVVLIFVVASGSGIPKSDISTHPLTGPPGPEGVASETGPPLAPETTSASGSAVDGITCSPGEQLAYHIHTHLAVYVNGVLRPIPGGIGVVPPVASPTAQGMLFYATTCYYWLHVHAQDGVIHIESPTTKTYTLVQFFDLWGQPLTRHQIATATGAVTIYVNGKLYAGNPAAIPLREHEDIQIDVGTPAVPPQRIDWSASRL